MREYTIQRDMALPLVIQATLLGEEVVAKGNASTTVAIFRTGTGRWVASVEQRQGDLPPRLAATVEDSPEALVAWLRRDGGGHIKPASAEALKAAAARDPGLAEIAIERVE